MKKILIKKDSKEIKILNKFLDEAFGKFRLPTDVIVSNKHIKSYLFKEDNKNVGVIVVCFSKNISYLNMIAVNNKIRSKGYGTKILNEYKKMSKGRKIILEIELLDPKSKDSVNKERRRKFYLRNGLKYTGIGIVYYGTHNYEMLTEGQKITKEDIKEIKDVFNDNSNSFKIVKLNKMFHVKQLVDKHKVGFIFDFNGTLYNDDPANAYAWDKEIHKHLPKNIKFTPEIDDQLHHSKDRTHVKRFMKYFGYGDLSNEEADKIWIDKELIYRDYCKEHKMKKIEEGTKQLINYLKKNDIPYGIASMAPEMNFDFYYEYTNIASYFNRELIVNDSDLYERKLEMYKNLARRLNVKIENCYVIEDSLDSINQAIEAGVKKIIYINRRNGYCDKKEVIQEVKSFKEINKNLIK